MKIKELQQSQPSLFEQFQHILEQGRLSHAYLFTGAFGSFEMAQILSQSLFARISKASGLVSPVVLVV